MTLDDLDTLGALRRRLRHVEAISRIAADHTNGPADVLFAVGGVAALLEEAGQQLDAIIAGAPRSCP